MQVYYNILETLETELLKDEFVNTVSNGSIFGIDTDKQTIFPLSHIMIGNITRNDSSYIIDVNVLLMDLVDIGEDETDNEADILNTQLAVGMKLAEKLMSGLLRDKKYHLKGQPSFDPFTERFENSLAGWAMTFQVEVPNTTTGC